MKNMGKQKEQERLAAPNAEGNVWPKQSCLVFEPREGTPTGVTECWYCRYADFHLEKLRALDVGVCYWPKRIMK